MDWCISAVIPAWQRIQTLIKIIAKGSSTKFQCSKFIEHCNVLEYISGLQIVIIIEQ